MSARRARRKGVAIGTDARTVRTVHQSTRHLLRLQTRKARTFTTVSMPRTVFMTVCLTCMTTLPMLGTRRLTTGHGQAVRNCTIGHGPASLGDPRAVWMMMTFTKSLPAPGNQLRCSGWRGVQCHPTTWTWTQLSHFPCHVTVLAPPALVSVTVQTPWPPWVGPWRRTMMFPLPGKPPPPVRMAQEGRAMPHPHHPWGPPSLTVWCPSPLIRTCPPTAKRMRAAAWVLSRLLPPRCVKPPSATTSLVLQPSSPRPVTHQGWFLRHQRPDSLRMHPLAVTRMWTQCQCWAPPQQSHRSPALTCPWRMGRGGTWLRPPQHPVSAGMQATLTWAALEEGTGGRICTRCPLWPPDTPLVLALSRLEDFRELPLWAQVSRVPWTKEDVPFFKSFDLIWFWKGKYLGVLGMILFSFLFCLQSLMFLPALK